MEWTWNYRIVNVPSENGGEDLFELKEVSYGDGKPTGYGRPCVSDETIEGLEEILNWMTRAALRPVLHEDDFKGETK